VAAPPPPAPTQYTSQINPAYPVYGTPTTQSVRDNFMFAKQEIEDLQARSSLPDAPANSTSYGRKNSTWSPVLALDGDVLDGGNF